MKYLTPNVEDLLPKWEYPAYQRRYYESRHGRRNHMLGNARNRAKKTGLEFNIEKEDIVIPDTCPILKVPLDFTFGNSRAKYIPSLDRIDNNKGYVKGNVQVISRLANSMKSNATTEELIKFANWVNEVLNTGPR